MRKMLGADRREKLVNKYKCRQPCGRMNCFGTCKVIVVLSVDAEM
jgi:hypothetical protein